MAEKEESASNTAEQTQDVTKNGHDDLPENTVTIEEIGAARLRIKIEIPPQRIEARLNNDLNELRQTAEVPGFRVGRAPQRLIEKRFGTDTRDRLKDILVAEALQAAVDEHKIKTLGEPQFDIEKIEMPQDGPLCFEVETDIEPKFDLPELDGIAVTKRIVAVEDKDVEETIKSMLAREGVYEPLTKGTAKKGDQIIGNLWLKVGDEEITRRDEMALLAGPSNMALMTVELNDLCENFVGAKTATQVTAEVTIGDQHANEEARGKKGVVGMDIKEIKRLKIPPLTDEWLKNAGWQNQDEFRSVMKDNLQRRVDEQATDNMRMQIRDYLLSQTKLELPDNLSAAQIQQAENRQINRLMQMGIPEEQAREVVDNKSDETRKKALDDTKAFFILKRIADDFEIEVDDAELNGQISVMANRYGTRPEKMRQQLRSTGQLETMANQICEIKALDKLLEKAKITEAKSEKNQTDKTTKAKPDAKKKEASQKTATKTRKKPTKSDDAPTSQTEQKESSA